MKGTEFDQLSEDKRKRIPDPNLIYLTDVNEKFVAYEIQYGVKQEVREEVYIMSYHPFLCQFTDDIAPSAQCLLNNLLECYGHRGVLYWFKLFDDRLEATFDICYWKATLYETESSICYVERRDESIHDGGGSSYYRWNLIKTSETEPKTPPSLETEYKHQKMPPCKGFWIKDGRLLITDPWGIPGIFEFSACREERDSMYSETEFYSIP